MRPFGFLSPERIAIADIETSEGFDCEDVFGHGPFQRSLALFCLITIWVMNSHTLTFSLISADVDHWCRQPNDVNLSATAWKNIAIPIEADGRHSRCTVYASPGDLNDTKVAECDTWNYDPERASSSIVTEWNLVCSRRSLKALATGVSVVSSLIFLVLSGYCADRFGRRPVVRSSAAVVVVATLGCCFAKSYFMYVASKCLVSGGSISLYSVTGTILAESTSFARRPTFISVTALMGLMLAETCFTILKQVTHLNWFLLQLIMAAPTMFVPVAFCVVYESPRWLIARRKLDGAEIVMLAAVKRNGGDRDHVALLLQRAEQRLQAEEGTSTTSTVSADLARVVRRRAVIMFGSSLSALMAYYVLLLQQAEQRAAAPWMEWSPLCANALAYFLLLKIVNRIDKTRLITSAYLILGSLCCSVSLASFVAESSLRLVHHVCLVTTRAACSVAVVFNFVYVVELFPTTTRGVAVCLSFAASRLGGMVGAVLFLALARIGWEDLLFLLISAAVCCSAYTFRYLPLEYGTFARLADTGVNASSASNLDKKNQTLMVDVMKQSLKGRTTKKKQGGKKRHGGSSRKRPQPVSPAT